MEGREEGQRSEGSANEGRVIEGQRNSKTQLRYQPATRGRLDTGGYGDKFTSVASGFTAAPRGVVWSS